MKTRDRQHPQRIALQCWLIQHGYTAYWLAQAIQYSHSTLSTVLNGHRAPSASLIERVSALTGIDLTLPDGYQVSAQQAVRPTHDSAAEQANGRA